MKTTKLFSTHEKLGAKIVDFAGFKMPVSYTSIIEEHKAVRNSAGLFDVSHMGEFFIEGPQALDLIQHITTNDASKLIPGKVQYSAMCYSDGGIVDDLLVYKISDNKFMLVVNASNIIKDFEWINRNNKFDAEVLDLSDDFSLLAIQGPNSKSILEKKLDKELSLEYYTFFEAEYNGFEMIISRTGYTGELGYELYFKSTEPQAAEIWNSLMTDGQEYGLLPVGLGARDTLRLEKGYCLYGNDIDETTNPLEAGLGWITKFKKETFIAKEILLGIKESGLTRKLVPLLIEGRVYPRKGHHLSVEGKNIGVVTSGTVSPQLEKPIALAYVDIKYASEGEKVNLVVRDKEFQALVSKLPFV